MKKTLIALAAVAAATGAMAQATISGVVDFSVLGNGKTTDNANVSTKTQSTGTQNTWTTSQLSITGSEDLGGGLRASFVINSGITDAGFTARDRNLALSGNFGTVRVGRFVPAAAMAYHGYTGAASALAVGTTYSLGSAGNDRIAAAGTANTATTTAVVTGGSFERNNNLIQYTSPAFNGVTVNVNYGIDSTDASNLAGEAKTKQQGFSVAYAAGPLSIGAGMNERSIQAAGSSATAVGAKVKADLDWIGASYNLGVATVSVAQINRKDVSTAANGGANTTNADIKTNVLGVSVPMGAFTFNASTYTGKNKGTSAATDDTKLSGHQLSVRYALSKRTTVYALVGENKIKRDGGNTANGARKETGNMIGLLHTF